MPLIGFAFLIIPIVYFAACYLLYRIGSKFGAATLGEFLIPGYNMVLLARAAGVSPWLGVSAYAPLAVQLFTRDLALIGLASLVAIIAGGYFWGMMARALGKDFWMGALLSPFGIPVLILAFDSTAQPVSQGAWPTTTNVAGPPLADQMVPLSPITVFCRLGEIAGQSVPIPRDGLVIGRHPRNSHLIISSPEISSSHVRLTPNTQGHGVWVEDLRSRNGTYVRQNADSWSRLQGRRLLCGGNRFYLGKHVIEFEVHE